MGINPKHSLLLHLVEKIGVTCPCQEFPGIWAHPRECPRPGVSLPWAQCLAYPRHPGTWTRLALSEQETQEGTKALSLLQNYETYLTYRRIKVHANLIAINN